MVEVKKVICIVDIDMVESELEEDMGVDPEDDMGMDAMDEDDMSILSV